MKAARLLPIFGLIFNLFIAGACGPQNALRKGIEKQNIANAAAKTQDLSTATGAYSGTVRLQTSKQEFAMALEVDLFSDNVHTSSTQDSTTTVEVPKLIGNFHFPALDQAMDVSINPNRLSDISSFDDLTGPIAGYLRASIDSGDYVPATGRLTLPYYVQTLSSTSLGMLSGTLVDGHFSGTWTSKQLGVVGTFDLQTAGGN